MWILSRELEYDLAGLDETWNDSQEAGPSNVAGVVSAAGVADDDSDSDMSDNIPQYDGANDELGIYFFNYTVCIRKNQIRLLFPVSSLYRRESTGLPLLHLGFGS